jgi:O-acetyl-ADP-ribose deacetylase
MKRVSVVSADITTLHVDAIVNAANRSLCGGGGIDGAIHDAAGPVWEGGHKNEDDLLGSCYRASLELAQQHGVRSIAFPAIGCGAYRFPIDRAAKIATATIADALISHVEIESVLLVAFDERLERALRRALAARPS